MFDKIYSKVEPEKLLHIVCTPKELSEARNDIVDEQQYLQLAIKKFMVILAIQKQKINLEEFIITHI